jgi:hypothetical protein
MKKDTSSIVNNLLYFCFLPPKVFLIEADELYGGEWGQLVT